MITTISLPTAPIEVFLVGRIDHLCRRGKKILTLVERMESSLPPELPPRPRWFIFIQRQRTPAGEAMQLDIDAARNAARNIADRARALLTEFLLLWLIEADSFSLEGDHTDEEAEKHERRERIAQKAIVDVAKLESALARPGQSYEIKPGPHANETDLTGRWTIQEVADALTDGRTLLSIIQAISDRVDRENAGDYREQPAEKDAAARRARIAAQVDVE